MVSVISSHFQFHLKVWWQYATLLFYFSYFYLFIRSQSYNTIVNHDPPRSFSISSSLVVAQWETPPFGYASASCLKVDGNEK